MAGASCGPTHIPRESQIRGQTFLEQRSPVQELVQGRGIASRHKWRFLPGFVFLRLSPQATHCFCLGEGSCGQAMPWQGMDAHTHIGGAAKAILGTTVRERHSSLLKADIVKGIKQKPQRGDMATCCCITIWIWQHFAGSELTVQFLSHHPYIRLHEKRNI